MSFVSSLLGFNSSGLSVPSNLTKSARLRTTKLKILLALIVTLPPLPEKALAVISLFSKGIPTRKPLGALMVMLPPSPPPNVWPALVEI